MAFFLNKVQLIGTLGKSAETRYVNDKFSVTTFTLATNRNYKGKDGNYVEETTWHYLESYNLSDYYRNLLIKGKKFFVEGRLRKNEFTDKEGNKRSNTIVIVETLIPFEYKKENSDYITTDDNSKVLFEPEPPEDMPQEGNDDLPF